MLRHRRSSRVSMGFCITTISVLFFLLVISGCTALNKGRSFSEEKSEGSLGVLIVPLFENETFEPILERPLTQIFKETLFEEGWVVVNPGKPGTQVLLGRIKSFGLRPISLNPVGAVREYRIDLGLSVEVLESAGGQAALSMAIEGRADYVARPDPGSDRVAKDRAIREAGRGMAEKLAAALQVALNPKTKVIEK